MIHQSLLRGVGGRILSSVFEEERYNTTLKMGDTINLDTNTNMIDPESSSIFAPLFLVAAILLICALVYSLMFLCVIRLGTISVQENENPILDGRIYFCNGRCYIPLCWFLFCYRRASIWFYEEELLEANDGSFKSGISREGRRRALENVLESMVFCFEEQPSDTFKNDNGAADREECKQDECSLDGIDDSRVCSICLMRYEKGELCISSNVCPHKFHKDCLLDWFEKSWNNTGCPCCRQDMVDNSQIIDVAKKLQADDEEQQQRLQNDSLNTNNKSCLSYIKCCICHRERHTNTTTTSTSMNEELENSNNPSSNLPISNNNNQSDVLSTSSTHTDPVNNANSINEVSSSYINDNNDHNNEHMDPQTKHEANNVYKLSDERNMNEIIDLEPPTKQHEASN